MTKHISSEIYDGIVVGHFRRKYYRRFRSEFRRNLSRISDELFFFRRNHYDDPFRRNSPIPTNIAVGIRWFSCSDLTRSLLQLGVQHVFMAAMMLSLWTGFFGWTWAYGLKMYCKVVMVLGSVLFGLSPFNKHQDEKKRHESKGIEQ